MKRFLWLKILLCVLVIAGITVGVLGVRFGKNHLHAAFVDVRNGDFFEQICRDFEHSTDLIRGFAFTEQEFNNAFLQDYACIYGQRLQVTACNSSSTDITVLGLQVRPENEDTFAIFLSRTPEVTVTIPAGTQTPKNIWFDMVVEDLENEEVLDILRSEFSVKILYVDASTGITRLEDADDASLQSEWVRKSHKNDLQYTTKLHETCPHCTRRISHEM